jgi:hypothetical protein
MTNGKDARERRRSMVLELDSQGYSHREIVAKLQISKGTVSNDLAYLRKEAQQSLEHHIYDVIPYEYEKAMAGMKMNLKHILEIAETISDPRIKLHARAIATDIYDKIMNMTTNGVIVSDAIKHVNQIQKDVNVLNRLDESIKPIKKRLLQAVSFNL